MSFVGADLKVLKLIELLRNPGGLSIEATVTTWPDEGAPAETGLSIELSGDDSALLLNKNGELLHAIQHVAADVLRLEPQEVDRLCFHAGQATIESAPEPSGIALRGMERMQTDSAL